MQVGLALPHYDFSFPDGRRATVRDVVAYAQRAERAGFDSVWISDHLFFDLSKYGGPGERFSTPEAMSLLTALAIGTERVRVGPLVLNVSLRHPRVLGLQAQTIAELSGGRFEIGLGSGWYEPEFDAAGIPFGTAGQRIKRLARVASLLDGMLADVPVWVGGKGGPKVLDVVAESADGWNVVWRMEPETYRARLGVLAERCDRHRRDPETVRKSVGLYTLLGADERDLERRFDQYRRRALGVLDSASLESFAEGALVGTAEACAARVKEFEALGVDEVVLGLGPVPFSVADDEQIDLVAAEFLPAVR